MEIPIHWRLKEQRYRLMGRACSHCDEKIFPPRDVCPGCGKGESRASFNSASKEEKAVAQAFLAEIV